MNAFEIMEEIMNAVDEDIHSAIDKKYPKESGKNKELHDTASIAKIDAEEVAKEHEIGKRPEGAPITDLFNIPAETPEEREYAKKESKWNVRNIKKEFTNNKIGDNKTRSKQFPKSYKNVGVLGEPDAKELEAERAARKALGKRKAKMNKNEALEILESILSYADNLFELDYEEKQNISPNKLYRTKKDKKGDKVEVVSVADELFPYEGDAKQQFNQKVLAKINDMIEGTGSLEDLIQFVRAGAKAKASKAHEGLDEASICERDKKNRLKKEYWENKLNNVSMRDKMNAQYKIKRLADDEKLDREIADEYDRLSMREPANTSAANYWDSKYREFDQRANQEGNDKQELIKNNRKKFTNRENKDLKEALELLEGALKDFFLGTEKKDPATKSAVGRTLRGKEATYNKHVDDEIKYTERAEGAKGYRAQVNQEKADDAGRKAVEANKDLRKTKGEYLDILRKDKGLTNPQAHAVLKRAVGEFVQEMLELVEGLFVKDGRGDLLDDIDTALGSPVKKKIKDIENRMTGCKQKRVQEALDLMEDIINELKDGPLRRAKNIAAAISDEQEKNAPNVKSAEDLEFVKDNIAKKKHKAVVIDDRYENQVVARAKAEEEAKKKKN